MPGDLLIRGARIIDGTGAPWFVGDARIRDGRIHSVAPSLPADDAETLDADGRYLAPGFIDAHCQAGSLHQFHSGQVGPPTGGQPATTAASMIPVTVEML
ncbi:MAG TPA: hypothetical protein VK822_11855 [Acetobacteraceae bacterium]|jgi:N-acyl-D-aspartate/D-glutamate deacylase|nr:hypothetical protein [Acetobacteraceae bacterium]HTB42693.1 hypothetical protein [Acetobacteraceae bacterium]